MPDDSYPNGHKYDRAVSTIGVDHGARAEESKPCMQRVTGGWCPLPDKHPGLCPPAARSAYDLSPDPEKGKAKPAAPKPAKSTVPVDVEVTWPAIGARYQDDVGRTLTITEICPTSTSGRHVVGSLGDGQLYACDRQLFDVIWKAR